MQYKELRASQVIPLVMDKVDRVKSGHRADSPATSVEGIAGLGKTKLVQDLSDQVRDTVADAVVVSIPGTHLRAVYQNHPPRIGLSASYIEMLKQVGVQTSKSVSDETRRQVIRLGRESDPRDVNEAAFALGKDLATVSQVRPVTIFFDDQHTAPGDIWRDRWFTAPLLDKGSRVITVNTSERPFFYKLGSNYRGLEEQVTLQPLHVDEIAAGFNVEPQVAQLYKQITNGIPYLINEIDAQLRSSSDKEKELRRRFPHYATYAADVLASQIDVVAQNPRLRAVIDVLSCLGWFDLSAVDFAQTFVLRPSRDEVQLRDPWEHRETVKDNHQWMYRNTNLIRHGYQNTLSCIDPVAAPVLAQAFELRDPDAYGDMAREALKLQETCLKYCPREDPRYPGLENSVTQLRARVG